MINAALIGYGYWGINVAKALHGSGSFNLYSVFDIDQQRVEEASKLYRFKKFGDLETLLKEDNLVSTFICTPPHTHFGLAKKSIEARKATFVEKPLASTLDESKMLYELAHRYSVPLYCDHVFLHSPAVHYLKGKIKNFGEIVCINARRINLGLFQSNIDVFWDLAIHDLSIIEYLIGLNIKHAKKFSKKYGRFPNDALANIHLELQENVLVNINVSWLSPFKIREMIIAGDEMSVRYDDTSAEKLTLCDGGVFVTSDSKSRLYSQMVKYRIGNEFTPELPKLLPLDCSVEYFAHKVCSTLPISKKCLNLPIEKANSMQQTGEIYNNKTLRSEKCLNKENRQSYKSCSGSGGEIVFLDDERHTIKTMEAMELVSKI